MLAHYIKRGAYITLFYTMSSIIVRGVNFVFLPYFLSRLTLTEFGIWDFYQLFFSTGTLVLSSCASMALFRFYTLYKNDGVKQMQAIGNSFLCVLASGLLFVVGTIAIIPYCSLSQVTSLHVYSTMVSVVFFSFFTLMLSLVRVREQFWMYMLLFCSQNFLAIGGTLLGVHYACGIESFFFANLISFAVFVPFFMVEFLSNYHFSFSLLKDQLAYSVPLVLYNILYMMLFVTDKVVLKNYGGFELLGLYGLLWRFGSLFQMLGIAMIDAWYLVVYNAQQESNAPDIIAKLMTYYSVVLTTCCLYAIVGASCIVTFFFPSHYCYIVYYVPLFFVPLLFIEIARLFQTAFGLSTKTIYMPLILLVVAALQTGLLLSCTHYALWGVFIANALAFLIYIILCYGISLKIYPYHIIDAEKIGLLLVSFIFFILFLHGAFALFPTHICGALLFAAVAWPCAVWFFGIIDYTEKKWLRAKIEEYISPMRRGAWITKK